MNNIRSINNNPNKQTTATHEPARMLKDCIDTTTSQIEIEALISRYGDMILADDPAYVIDPVTGRHLDRIGCKKVLAALTYMREIFRAQLLERFEDIGEHMGEIKEIYRKMLREDNWLPEMEN